MQKRAGLARAMIPGPDITLFDEPTAGLDPVNTKRLINNIRKLRLHGDFRHARHPRRVRNLPNRIAILHQGRIYTVASVDEIRESKDPVVPVLPS